MSYKILARFVRSTSALMAMASLAASAHAGVIDFNLPAGAGYLGSSYSQDGFTFTNSFNYSDSYGNWIALGDSSYNADDTADIFQNYSGTTNTITQIPERRSASSLLDWLVCITTAAAAM